MSDKMTDHDRRDLFAAAALCGMWSHPGMGVDYGRAATAADGMLAELRRRDTEAAVEAALPEPQSTAKWIPFDRSLGSRQQLPPERRKVLVQIPERDDPHAGRQPPAVAVGYLRYAAGDPESPWFVVPGVGGLPTHYCDCLGDDFSPPLWKLYRPQSELTPAADAAVGPGGTERTRCYDAGGNEIPSEVLACDDMKDILDRIKSGTSTRAEVLHLRAAATLDEHERKAIAIARSAMADHYSMSGIHNVADDVLERLLERLGGER